MTTKIMPATDLRTQIGQVLDELVETGEPVFITRHGRAQAVLLNVAAYDALIQRAMQAERAMAEPLACYQALSGRVDFSERGDAATRQEHTLEVHAEMAEPRRHATEEILKHEWGWFIFQENQVYTFGSPENSLPANRRVAG